MSNIGVYEVLTIDIWLGTGKMAIFGENSDFLTSDTYKFLTAWPNSTNNISKMIATISAVRYNKQY